MIDENGLYYMRARYYNPEIRRFINQDIVTGSIENSQSLNRYAYYQGNPVNYFDPFGLEPCEFFTGLGHGMLNLMGLIPGIGDVFDITNAIWYAFDGNWGRCFESGIASLPFIGNFLPDRRTCDYVRRVLNIASYGGTAVLAGQGMIDGGKALWADISSGQCSGWSIFLGAANIGLNGATLFFSGKGFVQETGNLNKMLKADGVTDGLLGPLKDNGGYLNLDAFKKDTKFEAPEITVNTKGELTNGVYIINQHDMLVHIDGKNPNKSQFLYNVDANKAVLDAAAYADKYNLWKADSDNVNSFARKAKVPVINGYVGITGSGTITNYINVYRTKTGYVHGCPGNP